jgi:hypothetical protein
LARPRTETAAVTGPKLASQHSHDPGISPGAHLAGPIEQTGAAVRVKG